MKAKRTWAAGAVQHYEGKKLKMSTKENLFQHTATFFSRHWAEDLGAKPEWSEPWNMKGSMPTCNLGGVYCLLSCGAVAYIGVGVGRGDSRLPEFGLSRRIINHVVKKAEKQSGKAYQLTEIWFGRKVDEIIAIGFPHDYNYLALALEDYLIRKLEPPYNKKKKPKG